MQLVINQKGAVDHVAGVPTGRQWASKEARIAAAEALKNGKGVTETFEDLRMKFREKTVPLTSMRKSQNPGSLTISFEMDKLSLLKRTYEATVCADSPVPGYIQVSLICYP